MSSKAPVAVRIAGRRSARFGLAGDSARAAWRALSRAAANRSGPLPGLRVWKSLEPQAGMVVALM